PCAGAPTITTSGSLTPFTACSGNASAEQSFTVSGTDLTANLVVTAPAGFEVSTTSGSGFGSSVSLAPSSGTVPSTTIYVRMAATATGTPAGNIACSSTGATTQNVAVSGTVNTAPTVTCPANVTVSNDPGLCSAIVNYPAASVTGSPAPTVTYSTPSGSSFPVGTTTVTVTATNICGIATCTFTVTVNDTENPTASPVSSNFQCGAEVPPPSAAVITDEADNCGVPTVTFLPAATTNNGGTGCAANPLIITRYYRVQDAAGNFIDVPHTITIVDNTPPVVTCPANITVNNTPGTCGAVVNFTPTATDNCGGAVTITSIPASGSTFPVGTTNVYVTATDACGNSATCTFTVTVNDTQAPVITCPSNISVANTPNQCGAIVNYSLPTVTDNCPGSTLNAPIGTPNSFNGITFDITNNTTSPMTITGFTAPIGTGTHPVEVYYTTSATTAVGNEQNAANW
ncbi:MAG TPA: HYR domain-containing protein, partial [Chitinophagaceae bacterium]|nr:HYR domain-containing protein [Chitinophagaceae bacterium]